MKPGCFLCIFYKIFKFILFGQYFSQEILVWLLMDIIFQKVSSPKCIKPMELNFQLSGATDHISPYKSSKRFNWIVFDIKEKNAQTVVHEDCQACCWCWYCWCWCWNCWRWYWCCCCPGCSLLWRGNCSTASACQRFQVFIKSHSLFIILSYESETITFTFSSLVQICFLPQSCECSRRDGGAWLEIWRRQRHLQHNTLWGWFSLTLFGLWGGGDIGPPAPPWHDIFEENAISIRVYCRSTTKSSHLTPPLDLCLAVTRFKHKYFYVIISWSDDIMIRSYHDRILSWSSSYHDHLEVFLMFSSFPIPLSSELQ